MIEIVADEVGPSLRWATAKIERNERAARWATVRGGGGSGSDRRRAGRAAG